MTDSDAFYLIGGSAVTATTTNGTRIPANVVKYIGVNPGQQISFIQSTAGGNANITAGTITTVTNQLTAATIAAAVWAYVVEGSFTAVNYIRIFASALGGKASGLATTTATFRDTGDTKARITATVDTSGNRTAVTLDGT